VPCPRTVPKAVSRAAALIAVAALTLVPLAGTAAAQPDRDCPDFPSRAAAQTAFDWRVGDPERLDADNDGLACEDFAYPAPTPVSATPHQVREVPRGSVDAGDGSTAGAAADPGVVAAAALSALAGVGAVALMTGARRRGRGRVGGPAA
jgi:hypothetical protein